MKKRQKVIFGGADPICGMIYACVIGFALMYTVCRQKLLICTVMMSLATATVYMLLFSLHKKPVGSAVMTGILTTACFGVILLLAYMFIDFARNATLRGIVGEDSYIFFLFTASAKFTAAHAAITIALFSVVIGFICCYFSVTMPRIGFLLLPALIPLILSTRTSQGLPLWIVVMLFAAYLLSACCTARPYPNNSTVFTDRAVMPHRAAVAACLAVAAAFAAAVIPKSKETMFEHYLDAVSLRSPGFYSGTDLLGNFALRSSVNTGNNTPSEEVLFTVRSSHAVNLDRWAFDVCNGKDGWGYLGEYESGYPNWELYSKSLRPSELFEALIDGAQAGKLKDHADVLSGLPKIKSVTGEMYISTGDNSHTAVVMHPLNTFNVRITDYSGKVYRTPRGEMFAAYDIHAGQYLLSFNAERPCAEYAAAMQDVDFRQLIKDAQAEGVIDYTTASSFLEEHDYAEAYRENTAEYPADERIAELAQEITEHCTNDYEKAMSIEKWFGEQEYVYDLEFIPESTDPSYFIFESKRGICSDFATAMTLLAREAGLSARYVEGFSLSPEIMDENGVYNVTAKNAHAYTQIYITGCGWVTFDATRYALVQEQDDTADRLLGAVVVVTAAAAVVFLIVLILRKPLSRLMFAVTYPMRGKRSCIKGVYLRARDIACELSGRDASCTTTGETQRVLTNVLSMPDEAQRICTAAERIMYSSEAADVDTKELYQCLKKLYRRKRGMR